MDHLLSCTADLATGAGIAALSSAADATDAAGLRVGLAIAGTVLGSLLAFLELYRRPLVYASSLLRLFLSSAQFFRLWEAKDSDVGASLVAIPLFFIACCTPIGSASNYLRRATGLSSALNAVTLVAAAIYYASLTDSGPRPVTSAQTSDVRAFLAVTDVAFAVAGGLCATSQAAVFLRGVFMALLFAFPAVSRGLLRGPTPEWLLALYGAALVQSAQVHTCKLRLELAGTDDPQRCLMLLVVCALAVGYVERQGDPANASFAVLAVLGASLLTWAVSKKLVQRDD